MSGSPVSAAPMLPHWCASSLIRTQVAPVAAERPTPVPPPTVATASPAGRLRPGAACPQPTLYAHVDPPPLVNGAPPSVERSRPLSPANQTCPVWPGTAFSDTKPSVGKPVAAAVKVRPRSVLT